MSDLEGLIWRGHRGAAGERGLSVIGTLSLNENAMDEAFMARLHAIDREEFPGDQMFTCGRMDRYDGFSAAR